MEEVLHMQHSSQRFLNTSSQVEFVLIPEDLLISMTDRTSRWCREYSALLYPPDCLECFFSFCGNRFNRVVLIRNIGIILKTKIMSFVQMSKNLSFIAFLLRMFALYGFRCTILSAVLLRGYIEAAAEDP